MTVEQIWADLMAGNERFRTGRPQPRDLVRERQAVAEVQHPKAMALACADSRVAPEIIFDQGLGDLFVVRCGGTVADKLALGSLEFAAMELGVSLLIVIGHQHCGGVKVACSSAKSESPNVKAIIKQVRSSGAFVADDGVGGQAFREAEKTNVRHVARTLLDRSDIIHDFVQRGELTIAAAYYNLDSGIVERL